MTAPFTQDDPRQRIGADNQKRDARDTKLTQLLNMQDVAYKAIMSGATEICEKASLIRAWDVLEDRIRILRGKVKPGSRNVSVRELSASEQQKRLPRPSNRPTDYLAEAKATLAQAEAVAARQMPDNTGDSQPK